MINSEDMYALHTHTPSHNQYACLLFLFMKAPEYPNSPL